ncbi:MAG: ABC transporter ATP-binding protein [Candidatus Eisenbacteria bacterium]
MEPAIEIKGITKAFPRVLASDSVSLTIRQGEVHALVGENGAGKTTLMNILYGLVKPDAGEITVGSARLPVTEGFLGLTYGIGMIHQHFMLIGQFTVLENIILGAEPKKGLLIDRRAARTQVERLTKQYGIEVDLDRRIDGLSVGEEQRVEILKVLFRNAQIIIMDEPTSVLTPQETAKLFATLRTLTKAGRTVIFITHKLEEVMNVADTVTVMRAGRVVGTVSRAQTDIARLAEMMVGRRMEALRERKSMPRDEVALEARDVSLVSRKRQQLLSHLSLAVRRGEIFGICGVEGNGQSELFEVLVGLRQPTGGAILLNGRDITSRSVAERLHAGLAHIPPDRIRMGLVADMSLRDNLMLGRQNDPRLTGRILLKQGAIGRGAAKLIHDFGIEPPEPEMKAGLLSGGNQQKAIAAREFSRDPEFLIASQPTRGLDIGAARLIHELLVRHAEAGKGVLLISADLAEVKTLSDRIGVIYRGTIVGIVDRTRATEEALGLMMAGAKVAAASPGA